MDRTALDADLGALTAAKTAWARTPTADRIALLAEIKDRLLEVAEDWATTAARHKQIPPDSPLVGEEWLSGPYAVMSACNALTETLRGMEGKTFLDGLPARTTANGQLAVQVLPHTRWDPILLSGVRAEVWMEPDVTADTLADHTATAYDIPPQARSGGVSLVLGAGNIASIAPLDVFERLFSQHRVVLLKMNPVNDYLTPYLQAALQPLIDRDALRIVKGGADVGGYLCGHALVDDIHITGAAASHDAIVWGTGDEGARNKAAGTPKLDTPITSELGAVCPTIVVPGPWSQADLQFQAEHIATQKLHNSGFNCIACQMLILPADWPQKADLLARVGKVVQKLDPRPAYYPGASDRLASFERHTPDARRLSRGNAPALVVAPAEDDPAYFTQTEVFAPALSTHEIGGTDSEAYLIAAIRYANDALHGTLGANILIHPGTIDQIGAARFEEIVATLRYGAIAINAWTGVAFLTAACPWGAFPGHTLDDVGSGIGVTHNTFMFDRPQRVVVHAPWRPFPRSLTTGKPTLLARPPWFVTHRRQHVLGRLLTRFQHSPSWRKLPRMALEALRG
ncbi:aldehyde dehydrogenase family protein [Thalassorhabdomicrobium marinisediminis]|uniref:Aldehyde dehydrogenase n=1 Tax=Thalassorhabdomicrobium marinisediminis TaxID=2170577 RepID=A0A2T7FZK7_9RHOB|nr:aldehyde dehydrogenase family protein [Thalassorhabdomicrobium marinisediminis]PVA07599.1 aldehyde dehydrogenase [Thalassorhabdomicrobium marinisediminis]